MTPEEAALALRDDPTFASLSPAEQAEEASALLGSDDPLDIALAIEAALAAPPPTPMRAGGAGIEPCRLETPCGGREPLAGNGRCLTCGANRGEPEAPETPAEPVQAPAATLTPLAPVSLPGGAVAKPDGPLTHRIKTALGVSDREMAELMGVSRPTAQAYAIGRLPEKMRGPRAEYLLRALRQRRAMLEAVEREVEAVVAGSI